MGAHYFILNKMTLLARKSVNTNVSLPAAQKLANLDKTLRYDQFTSL